MRILYLGLPLGALSLIEAGFPPVVACLSPADAPGFRRVRRRGGGPPDGPTTLILGSPRLGRPEVQRAIASARPDLLLSFYWPNLIPEALLRLPTRGAFGVHPSLLPALRGPDPCFWAIRHGLELTGVTLHRLAASYDAGDIVAQRALAIDEDDTAFSLSRRLDRLAVGLLTDCAARLGAGEVLGGSPQRKALVTIAPLPRSEDLAIDFASPTANVLRLIRAASPAPGAATLLGNHGAAVLAARATRRPLPAALEIGEALITADGLVVRTADGAVLLERVRLDDGTTRCGAAVAALVTAD